MTTVSLRFDDEMKKQLDEMCDEMGMNLTTFFMIYAKKALRDRRIPFEVTAPLDPFYSDSNMEQLRKANKWSVASLSKCCPFRENHFVLKVP